MTCDCANAYSCSPVTGECSCRPGWTGDRCDQQCRQGFYGNGCNAICGCPRGFGCDHETGSCTCLQGRPWLSTKSYSSMIRNKIGHFHVLLYSSSSRIMVPSKEDRNKLQNSNEYYNPNKLFLDPSKWIRIRKVDVYDFLFVGNIMVP